MHSTHVTLPGLPYDRAGEATTSAQGHSEPILLSYNEFNRVFLKLGVRGIKSRAMRVRVHGWEVRSGFQGSHSYSLLRPCPSSILNTLSPGKGICINNGLLFFSFSFPQSQKNGQVLSPRVLVDAVHVSALTGKLERVLFKFAPRAAVLTVDVPVVLRGESECPGLKAGGYLDEIYKFARLRVPGDRIPPYVVADLASLSIGESVRFNTLLLPEGCVLDPETYGRSNKVNERHAVVKLQKAKA